VDEVVEISNEEDIDTTSEFVQKLGLLVGISSDTNVNAARRIAARIKSHIITVLPNGRSDSLCWRVFDRRQAPRLLCNLFSTLHFTPLTRVLQAQ